MAERWSNKPLTQQVWEQRAKAKWGDIYDYSESIYLSGNSPIVIRCKKHDLCFVVMAGNHISKVTNQGGCPLCGYERSIDAYLKRAEDYKKKIRVKQEEKVSKLMANKVKLQHESHLKKFNYANINDKLKLENFINKVKAKYGDQYSFEKTIYKSRDKSVILTCKIHGDFVITPRTLLSKQHGKQPHGCPLCYHIPVARKPLKPECFFSKMKEIFGDKYDFSHSIYKNRSSKVEFVCPKHGKQSRWADTLLKGCGCPECEKETRTNMWLERIKESHGNKYTYPSMPKYLSYSTRLRIICPVHGEFRQTVLCHALLVCGCPKCVGTRVMSQEEPKANFIKRGIERYGDRFDYSRVKYVNEGTSVKIRCKEHNYWFEVLPDTHVRRSSGCPICNESTGEVEVRKWLDSHKIEYISQYPIENINKELRQTHLIVDFYLPMYNIYIEYNGQQHYEDKPSFYNRPDSYRTFEEQQLRDKTLRIYCEQYGIKLIEIPYWDFDKVSQILDKNVRL